MNAKKLLVSAVVTISMASMALTIAMASEQRRAAGAGTAASAKSQSVRAAGAQNSLDLNPARSLVRMAVIQRQSYELKQTNDPDERKRIILACNRAYTRLLNDEERNFFLIEKIQIDRYQAKNAAWQALKKEHNWVPTLQQLDPKIDKLATDLMQANREAMFAKDSPPYSTPERDLFLKEGVEDCLTKLRGVLSKAQREELDALWNAYISDLQKK